MLLTSKKMGKKKKNSIRNTKITRVQSGFEISTR